MLPADRRQAVEAWLASHPDDAARSPSGARRPRPSARVMARLLTEPTPARFNLDRLMRNRTRLARASPPRPRWRRSIGGGAGWMAHGVSAAPPSRFDVFTDRSADAHKLYAPRCATRSRCAPPRRASHAVAVAAGRLRSCARPISQPSAQALGGRLLPGPFGPAALLMYEGPTGERYTIYCARLESAAHRVALQRDRRRRGRSLGRARPRLRGQRPDRPRPAAGDRAERLRADGKDRDPPRSEQRRSRNQLISLRGS